MSNSIIELYLSRISQCYRVIDEYEDRESLHGQGVTNFSIKNGNRNVYFYDIKVIVYPETIDPENKSGSQIRVSVTEDEDAENSITLLVKKELFDILRDNKQSVTFSLEIPDERPFNEEGKYFAQIKIIRANLTQDLGGSIVHMSSKKLNDLHDYFKEEHGDSLSIIAMELVDNLNSWIDKNPNSNLEVSTCLGRIEGIIDGLKECYDVHNDVSGSIYYAPNSLDETLKRFGSRNRKPVEYDSLWFHKSITSLITTGRINKNDYPELSVDRLEDSARMYLYNDAWLNSKRLEWMLIDALIFAETVAFARSVPALQSNSTGFKWMAWKSVWKFVGEGIALLLTAIVSNFADSSAGVIFWIVFTGITLARWLRPNNALKAQAELKSVTLLNEMVSFYEARLNTVDFNPRQVRELLHHMENIGAVYSPWVFHILDNMIKRKETAS